MVFCKECQRKVEDCPHFVPSISARRNPVFDAKIETLAYDDTRRILEIAFKSGQVWQLFDVPADVYRELCDSTISSFLKFIAPRFKSAPVRMGLNTIHVPDSETCFHCKRPMAESHRSGGTFSRLIRVFWTCAGCGRWEWRRYGERSERDLIRRRH